MSAASSDIIEKYLLSLISCDKLFTMIAPTVVIISFWMVAFLGAVFRWCCRPVFGRRCQFEIVTMPESFQKGWYFVDQHLVDLWGLCCFFRRKLLFCKGISKFRDFFWFAVEVSCWSVDQLGEILLSYFSEIPPLQSLQNYASHISRSHVWWNVKWRTSKVWVETCTICLVYSSFAHTRLQKKNTR